MAIDVLGSYTMPINNPLYGKPPFHYKEAESIMVVFRSDPDVISELVPEPMEANPDGLVVTSINRFNCTGFGRSIEMFFIIPVTFQGEAGSYIPLILLDKDKPFAAGREIWGWEKKLGHLELEEKDGIVYGSAERGGSAVVKASVERSEIGTLEDIAGSAVYFCVKVIPSVVKDAPPEVAQLTRVDVTEGLNFHTIEKGPAALEFPMSPAGFLHTIPILEILGGFYLTWEQTLGYGTIVHDYLKPKKSVRKRKTKKK